MGGPGNEVMTETQGERSAMTIRLVQVGMGGWGRNWATNVIQQSENVELVACVDMDTGMLVRAQQLLNFPIDQVEIGRISQPFLEYSWDYALMLTNK